LRCPTCKQDLIVIEYHDIELDYCAACHGLWLDSGELELLLTATGTESAAQFLGDILSAAPANGEKRRRCPLCGRKMRKHLIGQSPQILIDACEYGDGLWFDGGELNQLLKQLPEGSGRRDSREHLIGYLGELFAAPEQTDE